jgi:TP901 family phage tail tape measure protein
MTNFDTARQALETSMNSAGSAMKEHEKWQQSLEARINSLKASWQSLSQSFMDSSFLKFGIDTITTFIDVIDKLISTFGTLQTLIGGFAAFKGISKILSVSKELGGLNLLQRYFRCLAWLSLMLLKE